ncbi:hypothetical protein IGJ18_000361 [Enterococcus sp. AZ078]|uniref:hypothetical protein n=1 Tax=Enterococcus sp. AZ078 TaxID=2774710 RepID=UPI002EC3EF08|nr:hypothetical protein [Enterococcus hirae]
MRVFFPDPQRRPQKDIQEMTAKLTKQFQAIDERLTLEHFDDFVDYGPEVFPQLAPLYWDPRVPNHPMEHFVYYEYVLRLNGFPIYVITPYSEVIDKTYTRKGRDKDPFWSLMRRIDPEILSIIHEYQIQNLHYWRDLYSVTQFQAEINKINSRVSLIPEKTNNEARTLLFIDPKQRDPEFVRRTTEQMAQELAELDPHLSVVYHEDFIDFGPEDGLFLSECPFDPEEDDPDDPRAGLADTEYTVYYEDTILYASTPYSLGYGYHGDYFRGGIPSREYLGLSQEFTEEILRIMNKFSLYNYYYWRHLYTPADFQTEIRRYQKSWDLE